MIPSAVCLWPVPYPQVNNVDSSTTSTPAADKAQSGLFSLGSGLVEKNQTKCSSRTCQVPGENKRRLM